MRRTILDDAIYKAEAAGWRLMARSAVDAHFQSVAGDEGLLIEVSPDGRVRDRRLSGQRRSHKARNVWIAVGAVVALLAITGIIGGITNSGSPSPPPTPNPATNELTRENVAATLHAGGGFMAASSFHNLNVDIAITIVTITVQPNLNNDTDALTIASADALDAAHGIFSQYPSVTEITTSILADVTDATGHTTTKPVAQMTISSTTAAGFDYQGLRDRVTSDNKILFCDADHYAIALFVYAKLKDRGCLVSPLK